jgi:hypothetical protein
MSLGITVTSLLSRKIRVNAADGKTGKDLFNTITSLSLHPAKSKGYPAEV